MERETTYNPAPRWSEQYGRQNDEPNEEAVFFTTIRQGGSNKQISFVLKSQSYHTLDINQIEEIFYSPEKGIILFFGFGQVHIQGRNLTKLYWLLRDRRISEIREFSEKADIFFDKNALFINHIHYESENIKRFEMNH